MISSTTGITTNECGAVEYPVKEPADTFKELLLHIFSVREVPLARSGEQVLRAWAFASSTSVAKIFYSNFQLSTAPIKLQCVLKFRCSKCTFVVSAHTIRKTRYDKRHVASSGFIQEEELADLFELGKVLFWNVILQPAEELYKQVSRIMGKPTNHQISTVLSV